MITMRHEKYQGLINVFSLYKRGSILLFDTLSCTLTFLIKEIWSRGQGISYDKYLVLKCIFNKRNDLGLTLLL